METVTVASTSVTLQWIPPEFSNGVITKYSLHYNGMDIDKFGSNANISDRMMGTVDGLSPNTMYVFEMKAYTMMGAGPPVYLAVKTRELINAYEYTYCSYVVHQCICKVYNVFQNN